jgi:glutamate formiminotransferase
MTTATHPECDRLCSQHSGMEEFKRMTEKAQEEQWKAIDGIKNAAWVSALSTIGTLVAVVVTLLLDKVKIPQ